jgi:hypothetical protein
MEGGKRNLSLDKTKDNAGYRQTTFYQSVRSRPAQDAKQGWLIQSSLVITPASAGYDGVAGIFGLVWVRSLTVTPSFEWKGQFFL